MASDTEDLVLSISADTRQIMNAIKRLERDIGASAGQLEKSFAGVGKGIDKSINTTVQKRINEITGVGIQATKEWSGALAEQGKEMERMRARFNPIFGVVTRYKAAVTEIQTAQRLGAISADEMAAAISRERQAALSSIAALKQRNAVIADTPAARGGNFNTANIAAQFQDIGVTAAMGMSPLQIALQQGTQLSAVLNTMGGTRGAIAGLGAAFMQIVNPVSLVTIGVVGLTAAALQYFSSFLSGSGDTEEALKAQADLIQRVADKWGDALPSLKAYADEQKRLAEQADVGQATAALVKDIWAPAKAVIDDLDASVGNVAQQLGMVGAKSADIDELNRAFEDFRKKIADGTAQTDDLQRVSDALASLYKSTSLPAVSDLAAEFSNLADQIAKASQAAAMAKADAALKTLKENLPALGQIPPVYSSGGKFINEDQLQTERANATKSQYQIEQERLAKQRSAGGGRAPKRTADDRFFEDIEAIRQRTRALAEEQSMIGMSFEAQTKRRVAFDLETQALKQVREEARRKGDQDWQNAQLSPAQVKQIDEVSDAYARQADELRKAQEAQDLQRDVLKGVFSDLRSALDDGKLDWNDLANVAMNALDKIIDKIENDLIDSIMQVNGAGGGGGFSIWNLLGLGGSGLQMFPGGMGVADPGGFAKMLGFASGTANTGGQRGQPMGIVHGQEAVIPLPNGGKVPVQITGPMMPDMPQLAANQSGSSQATVRLIMPEGWKAELVDEARNGSRKDTIRIVQDYDRGLPNRVQQISADPRAR